MLIKILHRFDHNGQNLIVLDVADGENNRIGVFQFVSSKSSGTDLPVIDIRFLPDHPDDYTTEFTDILPEIRFLGCLGMIRLEGEDFILMIKEADYLGDLDSHRILQIKSVHAVSFSNRNFDQDIVTYNLDNSLEEHLSEAKPKSPMHPVHLLVSFLNQGNFYYSPSTNLANSIQSTYDSSKAVGRIQFVWNSFLLEPILKFMALQDDETKKLIDTLGIFPRIISGFIGVSRQKIEGFECSFWVFSRISSLRNGTRFVFRGLDDDGNVANFVETEAIVSHPKYLFSYCILRGSVPVFWEQQGIQLTYNKIQLTRSPVATHPAFRRHWNLIQDMYGLTHALDLLSAGRDQSEQLLSSAYEYHIRKLELDIDSANLTQFDLNHEISTASHIADLLEDMFKLISYEVPVFSYCVIDLSAKKLIRRQRGIFRVNCFDCLDRTNIAQSFISGKVLDLFIRNYIIGETMSCEHREVTMCMNEIWADNGDQLSIIYTGSGALKSSITRTGEYNVKGLMSDVRRSAKRLYSGQFIDSGKNDSIRLLLGTGLLSQQITLHEIFDIASFKHSPKMNLELHELNIHCISWNVNGLIPSIEDFSPLFERADNTVPDIIVVGFQEIVDLNPSQIISVDPQRKLIWEKFLATAMNQVFDNTPFSLLVSHQLVGTTLSVFAKDMIVNEIRNVEIGKKMTGLGGIAGNKGSVAIWMDFQQKSFCFISSHFAAGQNNTSERNNDWKSVNYDLTSNSGRNIHTQDIVIWMGDLNYRLDCPRDLAINLITGEELDSLFKYDQLSRQLVSQQIFQGFYELPITFPPTYKFDPGTNIYDTSEKARVPSWTDRILVKGQRVVLSAYRRCELDLSDHKPVGLMVCVKF